MYGIAGVIGGDLNRTKESHSEHAVDDTLWVSKQTENGAVCGVAASRQRWYAEAPFS